MLRRAGVINLSGKFGVPHVRRGSKVVDILPNGHHDDMIVVNTGKTGFDHMFFTLHPGQAATAGELVAELRRCTNWVTSMPGNELHVVCLSKEGIIWAEPPVFMSADDTLQAGQAYQIIEVGMTTLPDE